MPLSPLPIELASRIQITTGDITRVTVDAIVNAANTSLLGGGGVDGAIHRTGGPEILEDCRKIVARQGGCKTGEAVITRAGNLSAKYVIHTVGPVWNGGAKSEHELLRNCYRNTLELAAAHACISVAFPAISTGIYRFPKADAAQIALQTTLAFLESHSFPKTVKFVCFDEESTRIMTECFHNL